MEAPLGNALIIDDSMIKCYIRGMNFLYIACCTIITAFFARSVNAQTKGLLYPLTHTVSETDSYFGHAIEDPYRWLEAQQSEETKAWVNGQNAFTENFLNSVSRTFTLRERIKSNTNYYFSTPERKGDYYFKVSPATNGKEVSIYYKRHFKNDEWQELFITKGLGVQKGEYISIDQYEVSNDSRYLAYSYDKVGSDWKEIKVADLKTMSNLPDKLVDVKHTSIVWRKNGFYYTRYDPAEGNNRYLNRTEYEKLYYHTLGTSQDKDSLIFRKISNPLNEFSATVSEDERFLMVADYDPLAKTRACYYFDFKNSDQKGFLPLFKKSNLYFKFLGSKDQELLFMTTRNGELSVIKIDPANPMKWIEKMRQVDNLVVLDAFYHKEKIYEKCLYNQQEYIVVFDKTGVIEKKIEIPFGSAIDFMGIDESQNQLLLSYESYLHPPVYAAMNMSSFDLKILERIYVNYDLSDYVINKAMVKSDTAMVPLLLFHKKNLVLDGNNPVLMKFYGGFGLCHRPDFDPGVTAFVENGGIFAYAMIRGGMDKGPYWHNDALLDKRHKSVDDIANCAKYLIDQKYTNASKIAITGSSHGGLMTALAAIKYPNLFAAAIPVVGVYDMLRFEKFTIGSFHVKEFGTVKDSAQFLNLRSLSPLHLVQKDKKYPAMLFMTSDYDDRVPPLHSYKMVAQMQALASHENPVLLRVEKNAGHNGSKGYQNYLDETTDFYTFLYNALGLLKK